MNNSPGFQHLRKIRSCFDLVSGVTLISGFSVAVIIALVFGVTMIRSAIAGNESLADVVIRQIIFGGIGFAVIILVTIIDYRFWSGAIVPMYVVIIVALGLLKVIGGTRFGATRWIETGLVSIQPTELAKIVVILCPG